MYFSGQVNMARDSFLISQPTQQSRSDLDVVPLERLTLSLWQNLMFRQQLEMSNVFLYELGSTETFFFSTTRTTAVESHDQ